MATFMWLQGSEAYRTFTIPPNAVMMRPGRRGAGCPTVRTGAKYLTVLPDAVQ